MKTLDKNKINEQLMEKFSCYLEEGMGLHYTKERWPDLEKKMLSVSKKLGYKDINTCISELLRQPLKADLIAVLAHFLTIGETYFFRDAKRMLILEQHILPEIIEKHRSDKKIRIWSAACSTGEEPYTIAMILDQLMIHKEGWDITLIGSDINRDFLHKAESGSYKKWSFRGMSKELQNKYFIANNDGSHTLIPRIKNLVKFSQFNLIEDSYTGFQDMDLVLCHNVLIYFSPKQIEKTISRLTRSIIEEGWLSISSIETPFVQEPHLSLANYEGAVFFKKTAKKEPIHTLKSPPKPSGQNEALLKSVFPNLPPPPKKVTPPPPSMQTTSEIDFEGLYRKKQYRELISALKSRQHDEAFLKQKSSTVLLLIRSYANVRDLSDATVLCEEALKIHKLDPLFHYMRAVIYADNGDIPDSIKFLKNALFLDPNFVVAHYMLGTLEQQQSKFKSSKRSFNTALELLQGYREDQALPGVEEITASRMKDIIENILKGLP